MTDPYETKYEEMQKYVPFIQKVIEKLKANNEHQGDNPRGAQLQKMEMLLDLLTNKQKKIKIETLLKCEGVLIKLQAKIEKNEDLILNDVKLKQHTPSTSTILDNTNTKVIEIKDDDDLGPASPPPEVVPDDVDQPVVIPTERRCSPITETVKASSSQKLPQQKKELKGQHRTDNKSQHSTNKDFEALRKKVFPSSSGNSANTDKQIPFQDKKPSHQLHHSKVTQNLKHCKTNKESSSSSKEKNLVEIKSHNPQQKLQTVKVVITEPLPDQFKMQHFASYNKYLQNSSVCHENLRTLPRANQTKSECNEAYSPEESWNKYNESHKTPSGRTTSKAPVFSRLGGKVGEDASPSSSATNTAGRYTPIPDVLKSPPLSASDINSLLLESGADKMAHNISEIGCRRPTKNENDQIKSSPNSSSLEFVRKKLAQTTKLSGCHSETSKLETEKDVRNSSPLPNERLALKYNPHPRQDRLLSISSTDSSECSTQSKINDPRIKLKLQTSSSLHSPTQVVPPNVNVLPAINFNDPRLKKQNIGPTQPDRKNLPSTTTPNISFQNQSPINYGNRKDPRISRIPNNSPLIATTPKRNLNTNNPQYSSEENWDSGEDDKILPRAKCNPRISIIDQQPPFNSEPKTSSSQPRLPMHITKKEACISKLSSQNNVNAKQIQNKEQHFTKEKITAAAAKKPQNKSMSVTTFVVNNPPKSDTEEDWDAEDEVKCDKPKSSKTDVTPTTASSSNKPYRSTQISPKSFPNPIHISPISTPPIAHTQSQYSVAGSNSHSFNHSLQNATANNRFNSLLNDNTERVKYLESKKQKPNEPRTYKEFREAKERAQAQEAAIKKAAEEAQTKKRDIKCKEFHKNKEAKCDKKGEQQINTNKKKEEDKNVNNKDVKNRAAGESTLDKMYRTQDFSSKLPKANISFKIPKKKTEEKPKEVGITKAVEMATKPQEILNFPSKKLEDRGDKINTHQIKPSIGDKTKSLKQDPKEQLKKTPLPSTGEVKKVKQQTGSDPVTNKQPEINDESAKIQEKEPQLPSTSEGFLEKETNATTDKTKDNCDNNKNIEKTISDEISNNNEIEKKVVNEKQKDQIELQKEKSEEELSEKQNVNMELKKEKSEELNVSKSANDECQLNIRDPRCRLKTTTATTTTTSSTPATIEIAVSAADVIKKQEENLKVLEDTVISSPADKMALKPQQNLEKFNKLAQELTDKPPQRILRRRNTMVVFDSAPLVDKDKLKKANALLFEDVQAEEKRKQKQIEEEKLIARRNRNLEEMFKKTDDNCTVSTQNIITGKRRTRASINFNETANAINVFKHKTKKDASLTNTPPATGKPPKSIKTNFKIKLKNLDLSNIKKNDKNDSDDDDGDDDDDDEDNENLAALARKAKDSKSVNKKSKGLKLKPQKKCDEPVKTTKKPLPINKNNNKQDYVQTVKHNIESNFKAIQNDEHQNCAVSSTSADIIEDNVSSSTCTSTNRCFKTETDDNEPTSTANKSNRSTPSSEQHVLNEIVDQILKPNADRVHILGLLGQILNEEKLELIKSLMESSNRQNDDQQQLVEESSDEKIYSKNTEHNIKQDNDEEEQEDQKPVKLNNSKGAGGKKVILTKKKRTELDRLNEDIRDMFICEGVLTATGRRMCTIMGKNVESVKNQGVEQQKGDTNTANEEIIKPPVVTRPLRRSTRCIKTTEDNEDDEAQSITSRSTEESFDNDSNITDSSTISDTAPQRKMPVLKPHTPIKIPEEISPRGQKTKETAVTKRKSNSNKAGGNKTKKSKIIKNDSESEENESEIGTGTYEAEGEDDDGDDGDGDGDGKGNVKNKKDIVKNTNIHWHNQSKYTTWCMICEKRILAITSSQHYKTHHGENYISRMSPVILQQFKQEKLNKPLFGVKKSLKQPHWFYRCPFCLKYFNTSISLWLEHFQNHTVEYRYECSKCHRCSNRKLTVSRHIKNCPGATILNSPVKLNVPTVINAHVCHLCNFIQLKRSNLERHYIEQHQLDKKTVDLLGYIIKLFHVENVEFVTEATAAKKEEEARKSIGENEQVIDIDDDEEICVDKEKLTSKEPVESTNQEKETLVNEEEKEKNTEKVNKKETENKNVNQIEPNPQLKHKNLEKAAKPGDHQKQQNENIKDSVVTTTLQEEDVTPDQSMSLIKSKTNTNVENKKEYLQQRVTMANIQQEKNGKNQITPTRKNRPKDTLLKCQDNDFEIIEEQATVQDLQDELLALAAQAAEKEDENQISAEQEEEKEEEPIVKTKEKLNTINQLDFTTPATISDIISSSIDMIYNRSSNSANNKRKSIDTGPSETKRVCLSASNVFMPTREDNSCSPTIQILAQSIINIEDQGVENVRQKPITMAERLSQRFKDLNNKDDTFIEPTNSNSMILSCSKETAFEKLINDTLLELSREKQKKVAINESPADAVATAEAATAPAPASVVAQTTENVFDKLFTETALEIENDKDVDESSSIIKEIETENTESKDATDVTVISDDEDWEDIEITETAPTPFSASGGGNMQKSKNKNLMKFHIFKGGSAKSKKHLTPLVYLPKKKSKEKPIQQLPTVLSSAPIIIPPTAVATATTTSVNNNNNHNKPTTCNNNNNSNGITGFKPVISIMDGLFPDSPCNDPIDLVPELAPIEPLQDLNDILSILDSNLSAVNINAADNHTSIEDALDFISEQQANDTEKSNNFMLKSITSSSSQLKSGINNIFHVGFSVQNAEENIYKFYCLLQNCSFLYSSDSIGLENHFMAEHSEIKWSGFCLMCNSACFPNTAPGEMYPISKEVRHMMEKHASKPILDLNTDSTQNSTTSSHDNEERPKIKLRRLTGDCLSRSTPENVGPSDNTTNTRQESISMLGALLNADPKPPTKEMPPQLQIPLTEPLLLSNNTKVPTQFPFKSINSDFLITSVTSTAPTANLVPLQISSVVSLNQQHTTTPVSPIAPIAPAPATSQIQIPKISNVRTLAPKSGKIWPPQVEKDRQDLLEAAGESLEVASILENAAPSPAIENREEPRPTNDSPVLVAETMPLGQSKTGDFVVTQTVSAQYNEFSTTAVGFNISIAASTPSDPTKNDETVTTSPCIISSRQYKCMGTGCKFVSRVPVAMSDHLRFHERRNFSSKRDYLSCGFCFYCATDVDDYMKHANKFHIIGKGGLATQATETETSTASSLTKKIQNILRSNSGSSNQSKLTDKNQTQNPTTPVQDTEEVYLKKLRDTIDEIVGPTGLADDKLYRCVVKNCYSQLTESTFLNHIMFHIGTSGGNPNNYIFKCPHCTAQYHRAAGIKAHIKNHARSRYFCYLCDETSTNPGQLLKHFSEKHWHTLNLYTKELLKPKTSTDGSELVLDSSYYVAYTHDLSPEDVRKFGEKLILEWQRKKSGSKTHFRSSEIDLLPLSAIFQREVNCGECEYKTKVRTNMYRHLLMHKQNPGMGNKTGASNVGSVDPVNPVPCLNSSERFFDKMTNLASSSLIPSSGGAAGGTSTTKSTFKIPYNFVHESNRFTCGCQGCNYRTISEDSFRTHLSTLHNTTATYCCPFCKEEICKRGLTIDRIINHTRFHSATIYHCEECNYVHHLRYVVERHINEKHATMKVNILIHNRSNEDVVEGTTTALLFTGKKYKECVDNNQTAQTSNPCTRSSTSGENSASKPTGAAHTNSAKGKGKWVCDVCGQKTTTVSHMQTHCQQQHGVKNQYKCAHCNFGSQQLSQILYHIDEKHSGKTREARCMYHKSVNADEEVADTRPLWLRNDPTRIRHIRGILMENEEESEEYRKKLALTEDVDDDSNEDNISDDVEIEVEIIDDENDNGNDEELNATKYITGYEFGCYHCSFKTQSFDELRTEHYEKIHNVNIEMAKPFLYRLQRRLCCPDCRSFIGNYIELQQHIKSVHYKSRYYAADVLMAENNTSQRISCGYCSYHFASVNYLYNHHLKAQHFPCDIRIDSNEHVMKFLALNKAQVLYQCTLCSDIFSNQVAIVQHACNTHAGEDNFSFRELSNCILYRCNWCIFTTSNEKELFTHAIDHYKCFKNCAFCSRPQASFNVYAQHCYAEHRNIIQRFRTLYPITEIKKFLLQILVIFPSGLVLNKRSLLNTKYGSEFNICELYEEMYKISQQPPIPRLSIARLVARKSIEAQQKHGDCSSSSKQDEILNAMQSCPKRISKRRCTVSFEDNANSLLKPKFNILEGKAQANMAKRTTADCDQQKQQQQHQQSEIKSEFNIPLQLNKISKRRRTVAVDRETLFSSNLMSLSTNSILMEKNNGKKRKSPSTCSTSPKYMREMYPLNLDMEPFSFYGQQPEELDLTKIYTKVAIGGIITPLTINKFKQLFNIECQLKLIKCDDDSQLAYNEYKYIRKACPASHKLKYL